MIHTDRITLVFPIAAKNRSAAASLQTLEITESGREFDTVVPLDPSLVNGYASEFNLSALTDLDAEKTAHEATKQTLIEAQSEIATLTAEVARLTALIPPPVDPNAVPAMITRTQARLVLHRAGLLDKVLEIIASGGVEAQIWYEANEWYRASPVLAGMALALGFTDEQVDDLFRAAGAIVP
mgnify:CR=1 FL=1